MVYSKWEIKTKQRSPMFTNWVLSDIRSNWRSRFEGAFTEKLIQGERVKGALPASRTFFTIACPVPPPLPDWHKNGTENKKNITQYNLTDSQVTAILELRLQKLTALGINEIEKKMTTQ